jgi:PKD repeat protein
VILPPAGTPKASFVSSPTPASVNVPVSFDASGSCAETDSSGSCTNKGTIFSYTWNFGDGASATGKTATHTFTSASAFTVTLTVFNASGLSASVSQTINATFISNPTAKFEFSPTNPVVGQSINFDASESKAATGHQIVSYSWNFGDGATAGGTPVAHAFATAGTYNVTLTVTDDTGLTATAASAVNVGTGNPTAVLTVNKTGGTDVFADGSSSTATSPATITSYLFIWGDGLSDTVLVAAGSSKSHHYTLAGTYTVTLRVTDSVGRVGSTTQNVTVP